MSDAERIVVNLKGSGKDKNGECGWSCDLKCVATENHEAKNDSFRMEMYAVLNTLKAIKGMELPAEIYSNNENIIRMCKKNWEDIENGKYENKDLWKKIHDIKNEIKKEVIFEYRPKGSETKEVGKMAHNKAIE